MNYQEYRDFSAFVAKRQIVFYYFGYFSQNIVSAMAEAVRMRLDDEFGHPAGDAVIVELVNRLTTILGDRGEIGRVGGEEFTIVLPIIDLDDAIRIGEDLRLSISQKPFACLSGHPVSASFGISWNAAGSSFDVAYARADEMLYAAKRGGRNKVMWQPETSGCARQEQSDMPLLDLPKRKSPGISGDL